MQLYISFFISGLTHHAGAYLVGRDSGGMYGLWLGQATVIMFEDLVVHLGKKAGIKDSSKSLAASLFHSLVPSFPPIFDIKIDSVLQVRFEPLSSHPFFLQT